VGREIAGGLRPEGVREDRPVVLSVRGLTTKELLKDVSFDLREGEILGFAGLMGAGRTEVARALVGADPVESGTVELRGQPVRITTPAEAARHRIGYLSEDRRCASGPPRSNRPPSSSPAATSRRSSSRNGWSRTATS
jgi:ribose transport system ATP-binding protein